MTGVVNDNEIIRSIIFFDMIKDCAIQVNLRLSTILDTGNLAFVTEQIFENMGQFLDLSCVS